MLMCCVIPFWKAFDEMSKCVIVDFKFGIPLVTLVSTLECPEVGLYDILASWGIKGTPAVYLIPCESSKKFLSRLLFKSFNGPVIIKNVLKK